MHLVSIQASRIKSVILDMDGVLWRDDQPIGNLPDVFQMLGSLGWNSTLATNNASRSVEQYLTKLEDFGVQLRPDQIVTSAEATAHYLRKQYPEGGKVYVIGGSGLERTLESYGFEISDGDVIAVVVSFDRRLTYEKLERATLLVRAGAPLIGTNPDRSFPTPQGLVPGAGAILAAVVTASDVTPVVIGKPAPEMYLIAMERMGSSPATTLVIGDRLETDIAGAQDMGCMTALMLSGVTSENAARNWNPPPDWVATDLTELLKMFSGASVAPSKRDDPAAV
jgi:4-nitrophenyl phosphatase